MFQRLKWTMFGVAGLVLVAFALIEDEATRSSLAGVFGVAAGLGLAAMALAGVDAGEIRGRKRHVHREENPAVFWGIVGLYSAVGLVLAVGSLYHILS